MKIRPVNIKPREKCSLLARNGLRLLPRSNPDAFDVSGLTKEQIVQRSKDWLKSPDYSNLNVFEVAGISEIAATQLLAEIRWGSAKTPRCPDPLCASAGDHFWRPRKSQWRCCECFRDFSVRTNTVLGYCKLSNRAIFAAAYFFCCVAAGISTIECGALIGITPKSMWMLFQKFREALTRERARDESLLFGIVHVDGVYCCGKRREPNQHGKYHNFDLRQAVISAKVEGAPTGRLRRWRNLQPGGRRNAERKQRTRVIISLRELHGKEGMGARRTRVKVVRSEASVEAIKFIESNIAPGSIVMTDDLPAYKKLARLFDHRTVCHKEEWVTVDGVSCAQSESYNSRTRRSEYGVHHGFTETHLQGYADEKAWREDCRRMTLADKTIQLLRYCLADGKSKEFRGYYEGNRPAVERARKEAKVRK